MMQCSWCGSSNIPIAEHIGDRVYCIDCGKPFELYEIDEVWFAQQWHKHRPIKDPDD